MSSSTTRQCDEGDAALDDREQQHLEVEGHGVQHAHQNEDESDGQEPARARSEGHCDCRRCPCVRGAAAPACVRIDTYKYTIIFSTKYVRLGALLYTI